MEKKLIDEWLKVRYNWNYGSGSGDGSGDGSGSGFGSSYGFGYKLKKYNEHYIFAIDQTPTIITNIRNNIAKGFIVSNDLTLQKTFVAKQGNLFAHGSTAKEAVQSLQKKFFANMDIDEKIKEFKKQFNKQDKYKGSLFFDWHNHLTGSCLQGRKAFIKEKSLSLEKDYTVKEFLSIVKGAYGWGILKKLVEYYDYEEKNKYGGKRKC